jgi:hypothetical protein
LKDLFVSHLVKAHPSLSKEQLDGLISEQILSPFHVELPKALLHEAQDFVAAAFHMRQNPAYIRALEPELQSRNLKDPGNKSICMSYDFHVDTEGHLKLIEVNTNASFLALGFELYKARGLPLPVSDFSMEELKENIKTEIRLQGKDAPQGMLISIIDEEPENQRLFVEFLIYNSFFRQWGWNSEIVDYRQVGKSDFIYNRFTDFYLEQPASSPLRSMYLSRESCLSPNPFEYCLLADKQRMIDWTSGSLKEFAADLQKNLPEARDLSPQSAGEIWPQRKKYFFKPKRAFGSKQSYRGGTVSRRNYDEIIQQEFIAQEFVLAPEIPFQTPMGEQMFKYDLRFYAYQDRVQLVMARLYQGQVTNSKTPYGGFAPVIFR